MRIGKAFLLGVAGSALIASGAMAADLPTVPTVGAAPPAAPVFGWAGPYAGASGGYDTVLTSGFYGVQFGCNFVRGGFLAGAEVETHHLIGFGTIIDASG